MSCVALLGALPRFPILISEMSADPEAHFQPATSFHKGTSLGALSVLYLIGCNQSHIVIASDSDAIQ